MGLVSKREDRYDYVDTSYIHYIRQSITQVVKRNDPYRQFEIMSFRFVSFDDNPPSKLMLNGRPVPSTFVGVGEKTEI